MLVMTVAQAWSGGRSFLFDLSRANVAAHLVFAEVVMFGRGDLVAATFGSILMFGCLGSGRIELSRCFFFAELRSACVVRMGSVWVPLRFPNVVRLVVFCWRCSLRMKSWRARLNFARAGFEL